MKKPFLLSSAFYLLFFATQAVAVPPFDPHRWMEDRNSEHVMEWVRPQNERTIAELEADPAFTEMHDIVKSLYFAKDRVPFSNFHRGYFYNFWQDESHPNGVIRRTTYESYKSEEPQWETLLDFDELSRAENENWVYKGGVKLGEGSSRRLLYLSRGGKDAIEAREFDYESKQFIKDGFFVPESKVTISPLDEDHIYIGTDFGKDSLTKSGYPRVLKLWRRGQPLSEAKKVFEGEAGDVSVGALVIEDRSEKHIVFQRNIDFFKKEFFLQEGDGALRKLPVPSLADILDIHGGHVFVQLKEELRLNSRTIPQNAVILFGVNDATLEKAQLVFAAAPNQSIEDVSVQRGRVFVTVLDNVRGRVLEVAPDSSGEWQATSLPLPRDGTIRFALKDERDPTSFTTFYYTDHFTPKEQHRVHDEDSFRFELLKKSPTRFNPAPFEAVQHFATSADGTRVPYFVLKRKDIALDGKNPTILYGYGGFEVSLNPSYSGVIGKAWLEKGGVYVTANIRGGGEFGPSWHQAALKGNRQRAFDDFIAVAEDLIERNITSPRHLGIQGGSNGGLLVGAVMVQRPELFNAALIQVPLLDMLRYTKLPAGDSWIGEYGDPENVDDCVSIIKYSPYQNVKAGKSYPVPMITTSTADDRVHPAHARKMAMRMSEQGHPFFYYESTDGGHAGSSGLTKEAYMRALELTYMSKRLR